jgi:hypothetical protein
MSASLILPISPIFSIAFAICFECLSKDQQNGYLTFKKREFYSSARAKKGKNNLNNGGTAFI